MPLDFDKTVISSASTGIEEYVIQLPKYQFKDIILDEKQYKEIMLAIGYEQNKQLLMKQWGMEHLYPENKGLFINLYGESGTGKTMAAHAIASALEKKIIIVNYAEIESKYVGETSKNLIRIFSFARKMDAILLLDEADALLSKRVTNMSNSTDVSVNQTKSVLLNLLNDYEGIVVFTTNFISNYDFAFMRRIPFQIKFSLPNERQRMKLWKHYLSSDMPYNLCIENISKKYENISGSDIANSVLMAALHAVIDKKNIVTEDYFYKAVENILQAKQDNRGSAPRIVSQREVTEEYALQQLGGK